MGVHTLYTPKLAERICAEVAKGVPIHKIAENDWAPSEASIYRWLSKESLFCEDYTRARMASADRMMAEILPIADEPIDKMGAVERARLRVSVRQWAAERMAPHKWGARTRQEISGPDGGPIEVADASAKLLALLDRKPAAGSSGA